MPLNGFDNITGNSALPLVFEAEFDFLNHTTVRTSGFTQSRFYGHGVGQWYALKSTFGFNDAMAHNGIRLLASSGNIGGYGLTLEGLRG